MKKVLAVLLVLCMAIGCMATASAGVVMNDLEMDIQLDKERVNVGETVTVTYTVTGGMEPYQVGAYAEIYYEDEANKELHGGDYSRYMEITLTDPTAATGTFTVTPPEGSRVYISVSVNDENGEYAGSGDSISINGGTGPSPVTVTITPDQEDSKAGATVSAAFSVDLAGQNTNYFNAYVDQFGRSGENTVEYSDDTKTAGKMSTVLRPGTYQFDFDVSIGLDTDWSLFKYTKSFKSDTTGALGAPGWKQDDTYWYYGDENGTPVTGWKDIGGVWYYFGSDGTMKKNTTVSYNYYDADDNYHSGSYLLDKEGHITPTGWVERYGGWQYIDSEGFLARGWTQIGNMWFYFNSSCELLTGWRKLAGTWYYMADAGNMITGWVNDGGTWYYFQDDGSLFKGWLAVGSGWYYLDTDGSMATGWKNIGGSWYYFNADGTMATGWVNDGAWYYFNSNGAMVTGWQQFGSAWYYFGAGGAMVTGYGINIGGSIYNFDANGVWIP